MKVRIPQEHYDFYRKAYRYLQDCPGSELDDYPNWDFAKHLIANYLDRHRKSKPLTHLLENDPVESPSSPTVKTRTSPPSEKVVNQGEVAPPPSTRNPQRGDAGKSLTTNTELEKIHQEVSQCHNCFLGGLRKQYVKLPPFPRYPIMVAVDIPSFYDQTQGRYFMDDAGALIKKVLQSIHLDIQDVYYSAVVKCSSSQEILNRLVETLPCRKHFINETRVVKPQLIIGFGKATYDFLMLDKASMENHEFIDSEAFATHAGKILSFHGTDIVFTYHPRDLLVDTSLKKVTWNHLKNWIPRIEEIKVQTQ